jgi:hypothetical protein
MHPITQLRVPPGRLRLAAAWAGGVRLLECCAACGQLTLATLTALTGARTPVVWFKICPVLLAGSAVLLLIASVAPA